MNRSPCQKNSEVILSDDTGLALSWVYVRDDILVMRVVLKSYRGTA